MSKNEKKAMKPIPLWWYILISILFPFISAVFSIAIFSVFFELVGLLLGLYIPVDVAYMLCWGGSLNMGLSIILGVFSAVVGCTIGFVSAFTSHKKKKLDK